MSKKQTAVEWLEEIYLTTGIDRNVHFNQAKLMECEQIINAHLAGQNSAEEIDGENELLYYKNTFGDVD
jgi:hypothetical protein